MVPDFAPCCNFIITPLKAKCSKTNWTTCCGSMCKSLFTKQMAKFKQQTKHVIKHADVDRNEWRKKVSKK